MRDSTAVWTLQLESEWWEGEVSTCCTTLSVPKFYRSLSIRSFLNKWLKYINGEEQGAGWVKWVSGMICDTRITAKVYEAVVRAAMMYGLETGSLCYRACVGGEDVHWEWPGWTGWDRSRSGGQLTEGGGAGADRPKDNRTTAEKIHGCWRESRCNFGNTWGCEPMKGDQTGPVLFLRNCGQMWCS